MARSQSWVGHTFGSRYKIEKWIAQGGMSTVYRAQDPNLRRQVAVKLIHPHLSNTPEFIQRFEQEATAVARLRHPNIVQVFDFNRDDDVYYMVTEFLPGETLQAQLEALEASNQRLPLSETVRIMATICDAVAYAHQRGMVHRDLKPANVMLSPQGEPILMDFGVAKMFGETQHTATGAVVGTALYMSPEQARGERIDERTDIYSLGVMLFEMIAGQPPFDADSAVVVLMKHVNDPLPDIRHLNGNIPEALVQVVEKALSKSPSDRFQTVAEMAAALRAINLSEQEAPSATWSDVYKPVSVAQMSASGSLDAGPARSNSQKNWLPWLVPVVAALGLIWVCFISVEPHQAASGRW